jgi:fructose-bisphosphate aldolase class 1
VIEYDSQMGNKYLIERSLEEIAHKLSEPVVEEEVKQEPVPVVEPEVVVPAGKQS